MEAVTRRGFIAVAGTGAVFGAALKEGADDKLTDGGIADVTPPGAVARETRIVPPVRRRASGAPSSRRWASSTATAARSA